jgi:predicted PurR-regulated permease PerM
LTIGTKYFIIIEEKTKRIAGKRCDEEFKNMEFSPEKRKRLMKWLIGIGAACIVIGLSVKNIDAVADVCAWCLGVVMPLLVGCAIAVVMNVPMRFLEVYLWRKTKKPFLCKVRRPVAFLLSLLCVLIVLGGVVWIVIPELILAIKIIVQNAVELVQRLNGMTDAELAELPFGNILLAVDWNHLLETLQERIKSESGNILNTAFGTITSLLGGIINLFISIVFAIHILLAKETLKKQARRILHVWVPKKTEKIIHVISVANVNFRNFISGQTLEAVILAVLCLIGMWIFGFPYAPMISVLIGVTALVPVVGGWVGGGIGAFMILTDSPMKAVWFLVFFIILQQFEGNVIYPKVMGSRVNLPSMWILAAVTVGGGIGGPIGMLLGVPLVSTAYVLFKEETEKRALSLAKSEPKKTEEKPGEEKASADAKTEKSIDPQE